MRYMSLIIGLMFLGSAGAATLSDTGKENRWAEQIVDDLIDGEAVWLETDGHKFLGILTPAAGAAKGGVVLAHGIGVHPNWAQVIYPLRTRLPERGWHTLSIQMPILANDAAVEDYIPLYPEGPRRLAAAVDHLIESGVEPIILIGHSNGAMLVSNYLAAGADAAVIAAVTVGVTSDDLPIRNTLDELAVIRVPVLDVYGTDDNPGVAAMAPLRLAQARKASNPEYRQVQVSDTNHFFDGKEDELVELVGDWLEQWGDP